LCVKSVVSWITVICCVWQFTIVLFAMC